MQIIGKMTNSMISFSSLRETAQMCDDISIVIKGKIC